ncbi:unnamed protein product, partial [Prorocentrum cordatum]
RPAAAASRPAPRRGEGQGARAAQLVDSIRSGSLRQWEVAKSVEAKAALGELGDLKECTRAISALGAEGLWESAVGLLQEMRLRPDGAPDAVAWSAAITACEKVCPAGGRCSSHRDRGAAPRSRGGLKIGRRHLTSAANFGGSCTERSPRRSACTFLCRRWAPSAAAGPQLRGLRGFPAYGREAATATPQLQSAPWSVPSGDAAAQLPVAVGQGQADRKCLLAPALAVESWAAARCGK